MGLLSTVIRPALIEVSENSSRLFSLAFWECEMLIKGCLNGQSSVLDCEIYILDDETIGSISRVNNIFEIS